MPADRKRKNWYKQQGRANRLKQQRVDAEHGQHDQQQQRPPPLNQLDIGAAGLMFTFAGKFSGDNTRFAIKEAFKLLETYVDVLKPEFKEEPVKAPEGAAEPPGAPADGEKEKADTADDGKSTNVTAETTTDQAPAADDSSSGSSESEEEDIADAINKEVNQIKDSSSTTAGGQPRGRFSKLRCKVHNMLIMDDGGLKDLVGFVGRMLDDLHTKRTDAAFQCRTLQRVTPFQSVCNSRPEAFQKCAERLLPDYFGKKDPAPSYAVFYKTRCQDLLARSDVIHTVTEIVQAVSPLSRVNLTAPDLAVVVESVAQRTCVSVLPDYMRWKRYSLRPMAAEEQQQQAKARANQNDQQSNSRYVWKREDHAEEKVVEAKDTAAADGEKEKATNGADAETSGGAAAAIAETAEPVANGETVG